jgi:transcriptional regulator with XRE-family HTH domain
MSTTSLYFVFSEILRQARSKTHLTQDELAVKVRVSREYISLLEGGKRTPTIYVFIRLARALGLTPSDLIGQVERTMTKKS